MPNIRKTAAKSARHRQHANDELKSTLKAAGQVKDKMSIAIAAKDVQRNKTFSDHVRSHSLSESAGKVISIEDFEIRLVC